MKRIYILIICFLIIILPSSCTKNTYIVELEVDQFFSNNGFNVTATNQIKEGTKFSFPSFNDFKFINYQYHLDDEKYIILKKENQVSYLGWIDTTTKEELPQQITISSAINAKINYQMITNTSTIILNLNGGTINPESLHQQFDQTYELFSANKTDHIFLGWCTDEQLTSELITTLDFSEPQTYTLYAKYQAASSSVDYLISCLPEYQKITYSDIEQIEYVYRLYNDLSNEDKALIYNYDILAKAYAKCQSLKKVQNIINLIDELPNLKSIVAADKFEMEELKTLYDELSTSEKALVTNYNQFEQKYSQAVSAYEEWNPLAVKYDLEVLALPLYPSSVYTDDIKFLYERYHSTSQANKDLVSLLKLRERIDLIYENLQTNNKKNIEYIINLPGDMSKNVKSKKELFESFFTDFYHYILYYHGTTKLEENNIRSLSDFLDLASDMNGGGTTNMRGIGNIACEYLLKKDINGVISNQPVTTFVGYCYQNNLYKDVLEFFINFFAYWRIDEGYANTSNYGADFFAESWAPTVDIAKFFYYDVETSYVKSDRMIDCLTNIAGVVYGMTSNTLPTDLRLRGYHFAGWYLTSDFTGEQITSLPDTSNGKVKLYAKWIVNDDQQQKDLAAMTEIYIYNLTTTKAVVTKSTVSYARMMYDKLTAEYKKLITNYLQLEELERLVN